jgi:hypothetical protein
MKMELLRKSAQDFELFGGATLAPSGLAPKIQKPK